MNAETLNKTLRCNKYKMEVYKDEEFCVSHRQVPHKALSCSKVQAGKVSNVDQVCAKARVAQRAERTGERAMQGRKYGKEVRVAHTAPVCITMQGIYQNSLRRRDDKTYASSRVRSPSLLEIKRTSVRRASGEAEEERRGRKKEKSRCVEYLIVQGNLSRESPSRAKSKWKRP